jgi:hypothetical protein
LLARRLPVVDGAEVLLLLGGEVVEIDAFMVSVPMRPDWLDVMLADVGRHFCGGALAIVGGFLYCLGFYGYLVAFWRRVGSCYHRFLLCLVGFGFMD